MEAIKNNTKKTVLEKHYECKAKFEDALCLFRVGDFYEMYERDAEDASKLLGLTLSSIKEEDNASFYLAGFPFYALDTYLPKMVRAGRRVVISD